MKPGSELYKPAEACKMAEVAPYVLRYWETEFAALSEGKDKGASRLYSARDVRIISRIRELLYDEGFTVAGAKKRLDAEMREGRFDGGEPAPPIAEQRKAVAAAPAARPAPAPARPPEDPARIAAASGATERRKVIAELKEIVRLLDRSRRKSV
jgi:DNA-binding transcriptional MerR regulator